MPIPAGAVDDMGTTTVLTRIAGAACLLGAAFYDGVDHLVVLSGHVIAKALDIFGAEGPEDLTDGGHDCTERGRHRGLCGN